MQKWLALALLLGPVAGAAQQSEESPIKFAFYSPAWGVGSEVSVLAGLRLVVDNQTDSPIVLQSIEFLPSSQADEAVVVPIDLAAPARGLAEKELTFTNLGSINDCARETLGESWKLVEISNYTLNPSVRRLIIEDTSAFRIYQCVSTVITSWSNLATGELRQRREWVLYHFESRLQ